MRPSPTTSSGGLRGPHRKRHVDTLSKGVDFAGGGSGGSAGGGRVGPGSRPVSNRNRCSPDRPRSSDLKFLRCPAVEAVTATLSSSASAAGHLTIGILQLQGTQQCAGTALCRICFCTGRQQKTHAVFRLEVISKQDMTGVLWINSLQYLKFPNQSVHAAQRESETQRWRLPARLFGGASHRHISFLREKMSSTTHVSVYSLSHGLMLYSLLRALNWLLCEGAQQARLLGVVCM